MENNIEKSLFTQVRPIVNKSTGKRERFKASTKGVDGVLGWFSGVPGSYPPFSGGCPVRMMLFGLV
jgi:hypothetical protein